MIVDFSLVGDICRRCGGAGYTEAGSPAWGDEPPYYERDTCSRCKGKGNILKPKEAITQ